MKGKKRLAKSIPVLFSLVLVGLLVVLGSSCDDKSSPAEAQKVEVVVSIVPLADFVENVGGDMVDVSIMVPSGASPHTYAPTPSQLTTLSRADMYVKVGSGVGFEIAHMDAIEDASSDMLIVDSSKNIELIDMVEHHHEGEEHDHEGDHDHGAKDPHIWLSPVNAKIMVENICDGLIQVDPENEALYIQNRDDYLAKLDQLDTDIEEGLSEITNRHFIVFHPAWGYFAHEYELEQIPIEVEGKEPSAQELADLIEEAGEHSIKVIFASPQFSVKSAQTIADQVDGSVVFINPLAREYINNLHMVLGEMVQAME